MTRLLALIAPAVLAGLSAAPARAGLILQAKSASTNMGSLTADTLPDNTRNQTGLSVGYASLTTDFDGYIASGPTHNGSSFPNVWISAGGITTGNFDFDLGGTFTVESFAYWGIGGGAGSDVTGFTLLAADNAAFTGATVLGSFSPALDPSFSTTAKVFTFAPTAAAFVRMQITSNNGGGVAGFGEAAFEVQSAAAVPEPASLALIALGTGPLAVVVRRFRRRA